MSESNTEQEKRAMYFESGASEVWIYDETGVLRFFDASGQRERSGFIPGFPDRI